MKAIHGFGYGDNTRKVKEAMEGRVHISEVTSCDLVYLIGGGNQRKLQRSKKRGY